MALSVESTSSARTHAGTSLTFSHTVTNGDFLAVRVGIGPTLFGSPTSVSTITFNGVSLTKKAALTAAGGSRAEWWYLVAPAQTTANVVVTLVGVTNHPIVAGATGYIGVDQTTPLGTAVTNTGSSATPSVTTASAAGEIVDDCVAFSPINTLFVGSGQTQLWTRQAGSVSFNLRGASSYEAGAASVTMSWNAGSTGVWSIVAVPIKPVRAGARRRQLLGVGI